MALRSVPPGTVAIDLTPVTPGGQNGGAKILAVHLVELLSEIAKSSRFILLTTRRNHESLASLDGSNVSRFCVDLPSPKRKVLENVALRSNAILSGILPPDGMAGLARAYRLLNRARGGDSLLRHLGADAMLCPFMGAPYSDPEIPFVSIIADLQFQRFPEFFTPGEVRGRADQFQKVAREAARIVCISRYVQQTVIQAGAPAGRTEVIYIALQDRLAPRGSTRSSEALSNRGFSPQQYLLYPANFWPHKNHAGLIQAFKLFCAANTESSLKLVFTGEPGSEQDRVQTIVCDSVLQDRIVFLGFLSDSEFSALLENSLALVFPSLFEGFGMPVLEAMVAGVPVLCSNVTSLPEVASDAALLFDPTRPASIADAISRIADDVQLRRDLIAAGYRRIASFDTAETMANRYWELLCQATATPE